MIGQLRCGPVGAVQTISSTRANMIGAGLVDDGGNDV